VYKRNSLECVRFYLSNISSMCRHTVEAINTMIVRFSIWMVSGLRLALLRQLLLPSVYV